MQPSEGEGTQLSEGEDMQSSEGEGAQPSEGEGVRPSENEDVQSSEGEDVYPRVQPYEKARDRLIERAGHPKFTRFGNQMQEIYVVNMIFRDADACNLCREKMQCNGKCGLHMK